MIHIGDRVSNRDAARKPHAINRLDKKMNQSYHGTVKGLDGSRALVEWDNGVTAWIEARKLLPDPPREQGE